MDDESFTLEYNPAVIRLGYGDFLRRAGRDLGGMFSFTTHLFLFSDNGLEGDDGQGVFEESDTGQDILPLFPEDQFPNLDQLEMELDFEDNYIPDRCFSNATTLTLKGSNTSDFFQHVSRDSFPRVRTLIIIDRNVQEININLEFFPDLQVLEIESGSPHFSLGFSHRDRHKGLYSLSVMYTSEDATTGAAANHFNWTTPPTIEMLIFKRYNPQKVLDNIDMTKVISLTITDTNIDKLPPCVYKATNMIELVLDSTHIDEIPEDIAPLQKLSRLSLGNNPSLERLPESIKEFKYLSFLNLEGTNINPLSKAIWDCFVTKSTLLELRDIKDTDFKFPNNISHIKALKINGCELGTLDESIKDLCDLEEIDLSDNLFDSVPNVLALMPKLKRIVMKNNPFSVFVGYHFEKTYDQEDANDEADSQKDIGNEVNGREIELYPQSFFSPQFCSMENLKIELSLPDSSVGSIQPTETCVDNLKELCLVFNRFNTSVAKTIQLIRVYNLDSICVRKEISFLEKYLVKRLDEKPKNRETIGANSLGFGDGFDIAIDANFINIANEANCSKLISHPIVVAKTKRLWTSNIDITAITLAQHNMHNLFAQGCIHGALLWLEAFVRHFPRFRKSPRGKFWLSFLMHIFFMFVLYQITLFDIKNSFIHAHFIGTQTSETDLVQPQKFENVDAFWDHLRQDYIPNLYMKGHKEAIGIQTAQDTIVAIPVRLRVLRVFNKLCTSYPVMYEHYNKSVYGCHPPFDGLNECTSPYGDGEKFTWKSSSETSGFSIQGKTALFHGGGYEVILSHELGITLEKLDELNRDGFIDSQTRGLVVDYVIENEVTEFFSFVSTLYEFLPTGTIETTSKFQVIPQASLSYMASVWSILCNLILFSFTVGHIIHESLQVITMGLDYFGELANWIDLFMIILLVVQNWLWFVMSLWIPSSLLVLHNPGLYLSKVFYLAQIHEAKLWYLSLLNLFAGIRVFPYFLIHHKIGVLIFQITLMAKSLFYFFIIIVMIFFISSFSFLSLFGMYNESSSSIPAAIATMAPSVLDDFDMNNLQSKYQLGNWVMFIFMITISVIIKNYSIAHMSEVADKIANSSEIVFKSRFAKEVWTYTYSFSPPPLNVIGLFSKKVQVKGASWLRAFTDGFFSMIRFRFLTYHSLINHELDFKTRLLHPVIIPGSEMISYRALEFERNAMWTIAKSLQKFGEYIESITNRQLSIVLLHVSAFAELHPNQIRENGQHSYVEMGSLMYRIYYVIWLFSFLLYPFFYIFDVIYRRNEYLNQNQGGMAFLAQTGDSESNILDAYEITVKDTDTPVFYVELFLIKAEYTTITIRGNQSEAPVAMLDIIKKQRPGLHQNHQTRPAAHSVHVHDRSSVGIGIEFNENIYFVTHDGVCVYWERISWPKCTQFIVTAKTKGFILVSTRPSTQQYITAQASPAETDYFRKVNNEESLALETNGGRRIIINEESLDDRHVYGNYIIPGKGITRDPKYEGVPILVPKQTSIEGDRHPKLLSILTRKFLSEFSVRFYVIRALNPSKIQNATEVGFFENFAGSEGNKANYFRLRMVGNEQLHIQFRSSAANQSDEVVESEIDAHDITTIVWGLDILMGTYFAYAFQRSGGAIAKYNVAFTFSDNIVLKPFVHIPQNAEITECGFCEDACSSDEETIKDVLSRV